MADGCHPRVTPKRHTVRHDGLKDAVSNKSGSRCRFKVISIQHEAMGDSGTEADQVMAALRAETEPQRIARISMDTNLARDAAAVVRDGGAVDAGQG